MKISDIMLFESIQLPSVNQVVTDEWVHSIIKSGTWVPHGSDLDRYLNDNDLDLNDEDLFAHLKEKWLPKRFAYAMKGLQYDLSDSNTIHRSINLNNSQLKKLKDAVSNRTPVKVGLYWSIGAPDMYNNGDTVVNHVVLEKPIIHQEINWIETIRSRMDYENGDDEHEIQLLNDTTVVTDFEIVPNV